jgi:hypothetical protein
MSKKMKSMLMTSLFAYFTPIGHGEFGLFHSNTLENFPESCPIITKVSHISEIFTKFDPHSLSNTF